MSKATLFKYVLCLCAIGVPWRLPAQENNCKSIQDYDKMRYCYATETKQKSFCYSIGDADLKNLCLAQLKNQKNHCYKIFSTELQNQCLKSLK